jgi:DNA-dependent RNA polymerase auxiliary subunit epsilon
MMKSTMCSLTLTIVSIVTAGCSTHPQPSGETASGNAPPRVSQPSSKPTVAATDRVGGPEDYDAILTKYVKGDFFDYASLKKNADDVARFDAFMKWQASADVKAMPRADQIAFYINAYNSCCIKAILDHYPVHSPKDIDGFFDGIKFTVGGEELTISAIEYDRLIANYKDMRAHFAVVCADRGCLPLKGSAWTGDALDADLEAAAKKFVGDERQFKVDKEKKEIWISKIFEWYGEKFTKDPDRPASKPELYLTSWVSDDVRKALESGEYKIRIIEWEWTLNEKHKKDSQ